MKDKNFYSSMFVDKKKIKHRLNPKPAVDKHVRCKCGKYYGMDNFRKGVTCRRCETTVAARGLKNE